MSGHSVTTLNDSLLFRTAGFGGAPGGSGLNASVRVVGNASYTCVVESSSEHVRLVSINKRKKSN